MPKLYEYLGIRIYFYSHEHEPIHVHGEYQGKESKAEIIIEAGKIVEIGLLEMADRPPLPAKKAKEFKHFVDIYSVDIVKKWNEFFIENKEIKSQVIRQKLK